MQDLRLRTAELVTLRKNHRGHSTGHNRAGGHLLAICVGKAFSLSFSSQIALPVVISGNKCILRDVFRTAQRQAPIPTCLRVHSNKSNQSFFQGAVFAPSGFSLRRCLSCLTSAVVAGGIIPYPCQPWLTGTVCWHTPAVLAGPWVFFWMAWIGTGHQQNPDFFFLSFTGSLSTDVGRTLFAFFFI